MEHVTCPGLKHKSTIFTRDGFYFVTKRTNKNGVRNLVCQKHRKGCSARAKLQDGEVIPTSGSHNHPRDYAGVQLANLREAVKNAAEKTAGSLADAFDEVYDRYPEVADRVSYANVESGMRKIRGKTFPPNPSTLEEFGSFLGSAKYRDRFGSAGSDHSKPLYRTTLTVRNTTSVVFASPEIEELTRDAEDASFDCTFKSVPTSTSARQFLTMHIRKRDHAFPVFYALMSHKKRYAYVEVLRFLRSLCPNWSPKDAFSDYETALQQAIQDVFPQTRIHGCWFHFAQAVWGKTQKLGLQRATRHPDYGAVVWRSISMAMALPLLPPEDAERGLQAIVQYATSRGARIVLEEFFSYMQRQWIEKVGPQTFSVYNQPHRTNNSVESFNRVFNSKTKVKNPNAYIFIGILQKIEAKYSRNYHRLINGLEIARPTKERFLLHDEKIQRAQRKYSVGRYTVIELLEVLSSYTHDETLFDFNHGNENDFEEFEPLLPLLGNPNQQNHVPSIATPWFPYIPQSYPPLIQAPPQPIPHIPFVPFQGQWQYSGYISQYPSYQQMYPSTHSFVAPITQHHSPQMYPTTSFHNPYYQQW